MSDGAGLDYSELTEFSKRMLKFVGNEFPKETRNFTGRAGNRLAKRFRAAYKAKTKKKTGNLHKGVKRGRPYMFNGNEFQVRVYNKAPHAWLVEHGHVMCDKYGNPIKKAGKEIHVPGKHVVGPLANEFAEEFAEMTEEFIDQMLEVM